MAKWAFFAQCCHSLVREFLDKPCPWHVVHKYGSAQRAEPIIIITCFLFVFYLINNANLGTLSVMVCNQFNPLLIFILFKHTQAVCCFCVSKQESIVDWFDISYNIF